jgi:hypothetical protein
MRYFVLILAAWMGFQAFAQADQTQDGPFAVVELFSSEGCSSCPSADLLISKLTTWARQYNKPVYPLIFHVDYWNGLGWRDIYSRAEFTKRQASYAHAFQQQDIYTPQIIVNGTDSIAGSNQEELQKDLDHELSMSSGAVLHMALTKKDGRALVKYGCEGFTKGDIINIALVERGLSTDVTAGENAGRRLRHDNVVREFQSVPLRKEGSQIEISLSKVSDTTKASVIAYVQNPQTMLVEAAKQQDLEND